jgi:hypothetical protein
MYLACALLLFSACCGLSARFASRAVDSLQGRPLWQSTGFVLLAATLAALPEACSPLVVGPDRYTPQTMVTVALQSNLLAVLVLLLAEARSGGKLLGQAGLDHLLAVVCATLMTLATAGAVLIESTEPAGAPFGHVLSLGLLIACVVHLKWTSHLGPTGRTPNPRAPLKASAFAELMGYGCLAAASVLGTCWLSTRWLGCIGNPGSCPTLTVSALAALPELALFRSAVSAGRADIGGATIIGSVILNMASMAIADLIDVRSAAYRLDRPVPMLIVALTTAVLLVAVGVRLVREERTLGE